VEPTKNLNVSYALAIAGFFTPVAGLHRFYLNRPLTGILWIVTWGLFGFGTLVDLIRMQTMVEAENAGAALATAKTAGALPSYTTRMRDLSPEQQILRVAHEEEGVVTVDIVAAKTTLSMRAAEKQLERMRDDGFVQVDISESGAKLYMFPGLVSKKPLQLEGL
jgi:TM2 domain-containing membrane protein YozV